MLHSQDADLSCGKFQDFSAVIISTLFEYSEISKPKDFLGCGEVFDSNLIRIVFQVLKLILLGFKNYATFLIY